MDFESLIYAIVSSSQKNVLRQNFATGCVIWTSFEHAVEPCNANQRFSRLSGSIHLVIRQKKPRYMQMPGAVNTPAGSLNEVERAPSFDGRLPQHDATQATSAD